MVLQNTRNVLNTQHADWKPSGTISVEKMAEQNSKENNFENFTCKNCGRAYTRKGNLGRHLKYECQKVPQFPCGECSKKFYRKEKLQYHVNTTHAHLATPLNLNVSTTHAQLTESRDPLLYETPINLSTHGIHLDLNIATAGINGRFLSSPQSSGIPNFGLGAAHANPFLYF